MTLSALKKKQIRDEIVVHLVNNELLDENSLDTVDIGKEERTGSVNSELTLQLQIKQMEIASNEKREQERIQKEIDAKKEIEKEQLALKEKLEREQLALKEKLEREQIASKEKL